jgi:hypothetical protein
VPFQPGGQDAPLVDVGDAVPHGRFSPSLGSWPSSGAADGETGCQWLGCQWLGCQWLGHQCAGGGAGPRGELQLEAKRVQQGQQGVQPEARLALLDEADKALGDSGHVGEVLLAQAEVGASGADSGGELCGEGVGHGASSMIRNDRAGLLLSSSLRPPKQETQE